IDENEGLRDTADRSVEVVEDRGLPSPVAVIVVAPLVLYRREIHRLGIDEFGALYGVVGAHPDAGIEEVRDRSRLAGRVVLHIHEGDVVQVLKVVVDLIAAGRAVRSARVRRTAAVRQSRRRPGVTDLVPFAHKQRIGYRRAIVGTPGGARRMRITVRV